MGGVGEGPSGGQGTPAEAASKRGRTQESRAQLKSLSLTLKVTGSHQRVLSLGLSMKGWLNVTPLEVVLRSMCIGSNHLNRWPLSSLLSNKSSWLKSQVPSCLCSSQGLAGSRSSTLASGGMPGCPRASSVPRPSVLALHVAGFLKPRSPTAAILASRRFRGSSSSRPREVPAGEVTFTQQQGQDKKPRPPN
jgi:hypothetical protein